MIPLYNISDEELSAIKYQRIAQETDVASYTELWLTHDGRRIIKLFSDDNSIRDFCKTDIENDISTLLALSQNEHFFNSRFVLPEIIYRRQSQIIGYAMPHIVGLPLSRAKSLSIGEFRKIAHQIYSDILFINRTAGFSFADLHEDNIILDNNGQIYHIDTDGWYCGDENGRRSRYLVYQKEKLLAYSPRYMSGNNGCIIPTLNTDLLCLMHIILNYLLQTEFYFTEMPEDLQERYLKYISDSCSGEEIVQAYMSFFSGDGSFVNDFVFPSLPNEIKAFSYYEFIKHTSRFKSDADAANYLHQNEQRLNRLFPERTNSIKA